jgi:endonuclease YncB( thermonuclease family)
MCAAIINLLEQSAGATLDRRDGFGTYGPMRNRRVIYAAIWAAMWLPLPAHAAIPDCAGGVEISDARVVRVEKNGALILADGRAIMLEGIRLPQDADGAPRALADQALAALTQMALAGPVTFTATPPKEDRYDRVRAQGFAGRTWLQTALLEQGLARVALLPDRNECSPELYAAEGRARAARAGLWALPGFAPKAPQQVAAGSQGSFQLVDGWVTSVGFGSGRVFIDFGSNGRQSFTAVIAPEDKRAFKDFDLDGLNARHIRIRGIVQDYRGRPEIALSNPAQIEILN